MVRPLALDHPIARVAPEALLNVFLQEGLVVLLVAICQHVVDLRDQELSNKGPRRLESRIQVVRSNHGLEGVGHERLL